MLVKFKDTPDNWSKWGQLVKSWIDNAGTRPHKVSDLKTQMGAIEEVSVPFDDNETVHFENYSAGELKFRLPTKEQVKAAEDDLDAIAGGALGLAGPRHYPLPSFYPTAFGPVLEVNLSPLVMRDMGLRRLGEYVIQECQ